MIDNDDNVVLEFDLEGFNRDDIDVDISEDSISIEAKKDIEKKSEENGYKEVEKSSKTFSYSSSLPKVMHEDAKIDFSNGQLRITIPKKK